MKKIRLMLITHDLAIGGLQQVIVNICKTINREKFNVSVLCLRNLGEYVKEIENLGIKVFNVIPKKGTDYFLFWKIAKILRQEKIEVIHTHNPQPFIDGTIGSLFSGVKTIIHTDHGRLFPEKKRYIIAEWLVSHFAYKIAGVSENTSENLIKYIKISPKKIITIENGIDGTRFKIMIDKDKKKKEFGINLDDHIIGTMGRLVIEKGYTYLLEAMQKIVPVIPKVKLIIVGEGGMLDTLKNETLRLGIHKNVIFTGIRLDISEILQIFDVFVLSSISEGLPLVLLEAMAAQCPIIATNIGGMPKVIEHGKNGSLVPAKNPTLLANEIKKLIMNKTLKEKYIKNGLETFNDKFESKKMTQKYENLYMRH